MKNNRTFFKCSHCGKVVSVVEEGAGTLVCCGEDMGIITPNTTDAATEKHVPVVTRNGISLKVQVGEVAHPMTEEHHISCILVAQGNKTQRVILEHTGSPSAEFVVWDGDISVYEYCNLHGLWAVEA